MAVPDWHQAEEVLFEESQSIIRQFAVEHPDEEFSLFGYSVDSEFAGVALNFDTPANSLHRAKAHQRYEVDYRNKLFALDNGWKGARDLVADPSRQIDDFCRGSWKYELVQFVSLSVWEDYYNSGKKTPQLEGRIIVALWRVVDRLVEAHAFEILKRVAPFRIGFEFHDDTFVVLRILDWPSFNADVSAKQVGP